MNAHPDTALSRYVARHLRTCTAWRTLGSAFGRELAAMVMLSCPVPKPNPVAGIQPKGRG